jgi:hypothetical protein
MRGQSANADCHRAPARHLWFTDVIPGVPFATPRARWTPQVIERLSRIPTVKYWRMFLRRGVRQPNLVANAPRHQPLRSLAGRHQSCQPAAGATQAVTPAADLLSNCHFASDKGKVSVL